MDSPFMAAFAEGLAERGIPAARFEFPYMRQRRTKGTRRPPDRPAKLQESWQEAIAAAEAKGVARRALVIGGKSMGGRMASMIVDAEGVAGLACLGYPFHAPGRPEAARIEHLAALETAALFVQGTRDALGSKQDAKGYRLARTIRIHWIEDGDHSLKPRKSSGRTEAEAWAEGIDAVAAFVAKVATPG
jgi:predicted alpha/beta-hydrolase family hydrolase